MKLNGAPNAGKGSLSGRVGHHAVSLFLTLLLGGFFGALLLRFGPGFDVDERDLDMRYSAQSREAIHREHAGERNIFAFYVRYIEHAAQGDLGISRSLAIPVSELIAARAGVTARLIGLGLAFGWTLGLGFALTSVLWRKPAVIVFSETVCGVALSLPAAVVALLIFLTAGPVSLVIGIAIFPRVFRFARDLFEKALGRPQVLAASARGVPQRWIFLRYVVRPVWAPLIALGGVSVSIAFGAAIPVEVMCDLPGLGQLAWKAALARDLPVLVSLTLIVTAITLAANAVADVALEAART